MGIFIFNENKDSKMKSSLFTQDSNIETGIVSLEHYQEYVDSKCDYHTLMSMANEGLIDDLKALIPVTLRTWFGLIKELPSEDVTMLKIDQYRFTKKIGAADYMDFKHLTLATPTGLKADYYTFLKEFLAPAVDFLERKAAKDIYSFTRYSGELVNKPNDKLKSITPFSTVNAKELENIKKTLGKYIEPNSSIGSLPYQKVIKRNKDWTLVLPLLQQLTLRMNKLKPKALNKELQTAQTNLSKFNTWLDNTEEGLTVTAEAIQAVSQYSLMIAKEAELFSLIHYYLQVMNTAMDNNVRNVEENIKA